MHNSYQVTASSKITVARPLLLTNLHMGFCFTYKVSCSIGPPKTSRNAQHIGVCIGKHILLFTRREEF